MPNDRNQTVFISILWKLLERTSVQGIGIIVNIVLARLLDPTDYAPLTVMVIFTSLANNLVQSGFNTSLIQNKDVTKDDYSSVFNVSLLFAGLLYGVIFFCAPAIERFYAMPELAKLLRVLALMLFPATLNSVQMAKIVREMQFKKVFLNGLVAALLSGVVGITMAYMDFGAWALVAQQLVCQVGVCVVMWFTVDWHPRVFVCWERVRVLFGYGWKLLAASTLNTLYNDLSALIIGKRYTAVTLAYYSKGQEWPSKLMSNISDTIQSVMLPALAKEQDDKKACKELMRRSVIALCFIIFPMMAGVAAVADSFTMLLLTEKWLPAVPYMQIACIGLAFNPVAFANLQAMKAMGRSDMFLKLEIIKKIIGGSGLVIAVFCFDSPMAIALVGVVTLPLGLFINAYPNKKIVGYSFAEQMKDIFPPLALSMAMFGVVYPLSYLSWPPVLILGVQIALGVVIYIGGSYVCKLEGFQYGLELLKNLRSKI